MSANGNGCANGLFSCVMFIVEILNMFHLQMLTSVCLMVMVTGLSAQQASYGAPSSGYDAGTSYAAPTGGSSYDAAGYDAGYADYGGYDQGYVATQEDGGLDLSKIGDLLPTFIVVFAAIILAQLLSPLLLQLLGVLVGILPMALNVKRPIIDAILAPFGLQLCDIPGKRRSFEESFRSLSNEVDFSPDQLNIMADFAERAFEAVSGEFNKRGVFFPCPPVDCHVGCHPRQENNLRHDI